MRQAYTEIAFWLSALAGLLGMIGEALTGYPGDLVPQDGLFVLGLIGASCSLLAAAALKRVSG